MPQSTGLQWVNAHHCSTNGILLGANQGTIKDSSSHDASSGYNYEVETSADDVTLLDCWSIGGDHGFISKTSARTRFQRCVANGQSGFGFYAKAGVDTEIYHCDSHSGQVGVAALWDDTSTNSRCGVAIRNTIITNATTAAISVDALSQSGFDSDYNDFDGNTRVGVWGGNNETTLADWQSASSGDVNSLTVDPAYISAVYDGCVPTATAVLVGGGDIGEGAGLPRWGTRAAHTP